MVVIGTQSYIANTILRQFMISQTSLTRFFLSFLAIYHLGPEKAQIKSLVFDTT